MENPRFETAKLGEVSDDYYFGAECQQCRHRRRLSLAKLRAHLGDDFPLVKIRPRLRCELCGSKKVIISFLAPNNKYGNLAHLFNETPR